HNVSLVSRQVHLLAKSTFSLSSTRPSGSFSISIRTVCHRWSTSSYWRSTASRRASTRMPSAAIPPRKPRPNRDSPNRPPGANRRGVVTMSSGPSEERDVPASKRLDPGTGLRIARPVRHLVGYPETLNHYLTVAKRRERLGGSKRPIQRTLLAGPKEGGQIES